MTAFLSIASIAALIYLVAYCHAPSSWPKTGVKTASVACLALAALWAGGPGLLVLALALCAAGDYLLARDTEPTFLAGVGAFAAGHLAYVALFLSTPGAQLAALTTPIPVLTLTALAIYGLVMMRLLFHKAGDLRFAVMGYVPIILAMGVAALTVPAEGALWLVLPAAFLFMISDSVLAAELFLLPASHPLRRITPFVVWSFYWLAQLGFLMAYTGGL